MVHRDAPTSVPLFKYGHFYAMKRKKSKSHALYWDFSTHLNHLPKAKSVRFHLVGQFPANLLRVAFGRSSHSCETAKSLRLVDDEEEENVVDILQVDLS